MGRIAVEYEIAAPRASALVESLRGVGYSTATAIADLIDNSVSAGARNVWLQFRFAGPQSWVSVLDDGSGMDEAGLRQAMVLGARHPGEKRAACDLGRFGLGLKTASFSQCRCLTVASRQAAGRIAVRRWDLDYIAKSDVDDWRLLPETRGGSEHLLDPLGQLGSGTLVLWENLDRLIGGARADDRKSEDAFNQMIEQVDDHLGMVFHRFLEGGGALLRLYINGSRVKPWDPFMQFHPATDVGPTETISTPNGPVELQGFVLPHKDQLTEEENRRGGGSEGWAAHQGFYVYRSRRLLVAGGWLGLGSARPWTMEEPYRLARLRTEFGNDGDGSWEIDVKKSIARPPRMLRPRMTALADIVRTKARRVFAHRGSYGPHAPVVDLVPAWEQNNAGKSGRYRINRLHPLVALAVEQAGQPVDHVEAALKVIEATVPVERIWLDAADRGEVVDQTASGIAASELLGIARGLVSHWTSKIGMTAEQAIAKLSSTDPFQNHPDVLVEIGAMLAGTEHRK